MPGMDILNTIKENVNESSMGLVTKKTVGGKKPLQLVPQTVHLTVTSKMVPTRNVLKVPLPHRPSGITVCVIVKDADKRDYNKTTEAWKRRWQADLRKSKCEKITMPTFLPLRELKLAYQQYSAKRRLAATFDVFLADRRIAHHLPSNLGKSFYLNSCKMPLPLDVEKGNLVNRFTSALKTALFAVHDLGVLNTMAIGDVSMSNEEIGENILAVCEKVVSSWPGGAQNIRSIYVRGAGCNVPLYYDAGEPPLPMVCESVQQSGRVNLEAEKLVRQLKELDAIPEGVDFASGTPNSSKPKSKDVLINAITEVANDLPIAPGKLIDILAALEKNNRRPKRAKNTKTTSVRSSTKHPVTLKMKARKR